MNIMKTIQKLTYEDFLVQYADTRAEWVDGEVIIFPSESARHQDISDFLLCILTIYVQSRSLGKVLAAPFQIKLGPDLPGREPDLLYVASDHLDRLKETYLDDPADMVVEIVSKKSIVRDRGEKFVDYETAGVSEYWLIDPLRQQAQFYRRGLDNYYHLIMPDDEGIYHSEVVKGFWLRVSWLWKEPLPPVLDVWKELNLLT